MDETRSSSDSPKGDRPATDRAFGPGKIVVWIVVLLVAGWWFRPSELPPLKLPAERESGRGGPLVRVALHPKPVASFRLSVDGPFRVEAVGGQTPLLAARSLPEVEVVATQTGFRIGSKTVSGDRLELRPDKSPSVWVDGHQYRGRLRLAKSTSGRVLAVNVVPLEDYLGSVVDSEMPREFGREARRAQAVVARTFALMALRDAEPGDEQDLYASVRSQKYLGVKYRTEGGELLAGESEDSRDVVAGTRAWVCTSGGELFRTYYCSTCGGRTLRGTALFPDAAAPVRSVPCEYCREAPLHHWSVRISRAELDADLAALARRKRISLGRVRSIAPAGGDVPGEVSRFRVVGDKGTLEVTGAELRPVWSARGVSSPRFTIRLGRTDCVLEGQGHGHGAGLCQWGARGQAKAGRTCEQILAYYFPGARVLRAGY
jgi:stage II sporulation protein D